MKRSSLWLFCSLVACAPSVDLILRPVTETRGPTLTSLEFVGQSLGDGCDFTFAGSQEIAAELPLIAPVRLPQEVQDCPVQLEARLLVGSVEVGRSSTTLSPGQKEATLLFTLCSNGLQEAQELCDDANLTDGDGCDSTCKPTGCSSGVATPGELCFAENDNLIGPVNPLQVLADDINGDGLPDLIAPYREEGVVRVFSNQGVGLFGDFDTISVPGVERLSLADLDEDGDTDLVASVHRFGFAPELVLLSNEDGLFSAGVPTPLSALDVSAIALGDLDGDGKLDLVFTDKNTSLLKVNLGEDGGGFGSQAQALSVGFEPIALVLEDADNDGDVDAFTANASGSVSVLLNTGGVFVSGLLLLVDGVPSAMVVSDFNGDGLLDLAVSKEEAGSGKVRLFKGEAQGFIKVADFDLGTQPSALLAADLDLDGDLDLAATNQSESTIVVLFNNGQIQFDPPRDASAGTFDTRKGPVSLAVSDLNRDGVPDLIAAGENLGLLLSNP